MPTRHIIVVGASGGGIEALRTLVSGLPVDFPVPGSLDDGTAAVGIEEAMIQQP